jgi:hypothetical protein
MSLALSLLRPLLQPRILASKPVSHLLASPLFYPSHPTFFALKLQGMRFYSTDTRVATLIQAVQQQDTKTIALIAQAQPQLIVEQTHSDNTALHEAARRGDVAMINVLSKEFSSSFNVNHRCHCTLKRTPLAYAVEGGHLDAVKLLLRMGGDPNITNEHNETALDIALRVMKKPGTDKAAFEQVALTLFEKGGTSKFPEETKRLMVMSKANAFSANLLSQKSQESSHFTQQYLTTLKQNKLTNGVKK